MSRKLTRSIVIMLAIVLLLMILLKNRTPFGKGNSSFATEPEREITRIKFSDNNQELILEKSEENWLLNGKIETRKSSIIFINRVLKEIQIKSPVSEQLFDSEITDKGIIPVRVKVYEKRKLISSFLVYKTASNKYGNIMKIKEDSKLFIVYVPGYEGDIGSSFTLNELFWQPFTIFNALPSEIESIDFENLSDTINSFSIISKNHRYFVSDRTRNLTGWDSTLVSRYLSYFTMIPFESWAFEPGNEEQKKIESQQPLYRITVSTEKGVKRVLTLWERGTEENSSENKDTDRLYGKTQDREALFVVRYFDIDPILKKRSYFFPG